MNAEAPLAGLRVVEVALGTSAVGAGPATSLPGTIFRDLGADVARVQSAGRSTLDAGVDFERVWNRGKEVTEVDDEAVPSMVRSLARENDVVFLAGSESGIERHGIGARDLARLDPALVVVRVRPSFDARGAVPDLELLARDADPQPSRRRSGVSRSRHRRDGRRARRDRRRSRAAVRARTDRRRWVGRDVALRRCPRAAPHDHRTRRASLTHDQPAVARSRPSRSAVVPLCRRRIRAAVVRREGRIRIVPRTRRRPAERTRVQRRSHERRDGRARQSMGRDVRHTRARVLARRPRRSRLSVRAGVATGRGVA